MRRSAAIAGLAAAVLALWVAGCAPAPQEPASPVKAGSYSVTDATARRLTFNEKPQRIVSLSISADEMLLDMVAPERIAALTYLADDAGISSVAEKARSVKARVLSGSLESVLGPQPDLVLAPDWMDADFVELLRSAHVPVYVFKTPGTIDGVKKTVLELAAVLGEKEAGAKVAARMDEELAFVRSRVGDIPPEARIGVMALSYMGAIGLKGSTFDDICARANVRNLVGDYDLPPNVVFSEETMVKLDPQLLLLPSWRYGNEEDPEQMREDILRNPAYQSIRAVRDKRVVQLRDNYLHSTSHYIVYAVRELAEAAYPERFKNVDAEK